MEIMVELHGLWQTVPSTRICRALEDYRPYWVEDAIRLDSFEALSRLREATSVRFAFGETMGNKFDFKRLFDTGAIDVVLFDFGWSGGISEALRVAALAESYGIPVAPHDCVGPVALCIGAHFSVSTPMCWSKRPCAPTTPTGTRKLSRSCRLSGTAASHRGGPRARG